VISPEPFIQKCTSLAKAKNPYLEVLEGRVRLAWAVGSNDGHVEYMERIDLIGLGITYDMLIDALLEAGGTGYPINDDIRTALRRFWKH
jgi:hypothetical protein